jgi:hypothetical protein
MRQASALFFKYVGKLFIDTKDNLHFQVTNIVTQRAGNKGYTPFFKYFDTSKFSSAPSLEEDLEFTPCSEFVKKRQATGVNFVGHTEY